VEKREFVAKLVRTGTLRPSLRGNLLRQPDKHLDHNGVSRHKSLGFNAAPVETVKFVTVLSNYRMLLVGQDLLEEFVSIAR